MAKYNGAKCRLCRRQGEKLFLRGEVCESAKCPMIKRKYPPGMHGMRRAEKVSDYGKQLREKQKAKRIYGILEKQFSHYFKKAIRAKGDTAFNLLTFLEARLDNVIFKAGFATTRSATRQLVTHSHILVNNKKVNIPSFQVKPKDIIKFKDSSSFKTKLKELIEQKMQKIKLPSWLSFDEKTLEIKVSTLPIKDDLPQNIDASLIVEFYSR